MKYFIIILSFFLSTISYSQTFINRAGPANTVQDDKLAAKNAFYLPRLSDTAFVSGALDSIGLLIYDRLRAKIAIRDTVLSGGHKWTFLLKEGDVASALANNGLSKSGDTIQLGGPLVHSTNISIGDNDLSISAFNNITNSSTRFTIDNTNMGMSGRYEDFSSINNIYVNQDNIQLISNQSSKSRRILIDSTTGIQIGENISGIYKGIYINKNTAQLQFNGIDDFSTTDTSFNTLVVDGSGNIFKRSGDHGALSGMGTANQFTYWTGTSSIGGNNNFTLDATIGKATFASTGAGQTAIWLQHQDSTVGVVGGWQPWVFASNEYPNTQPSEGTINNFTNFSGYNLTANGGRVNTSEPQQIEQHERAYVIAGYSLCTEHWWGQTNANGNTIRPLYNIRSWYGRKSLFKLTATNFEWNDDSTDINVMALNPNGLLQLSAANTGNQPMLLVNAPAASNFVLQQRNSTNTANMALIGAVNDTTISIGGSGRITLSTKYITENSGINGYYLGGTSFRAGGLIADHAVGDIQMYSFNNAWPLRFVIQGVERMKIDNTDIYANSLTTGASTDSAVTWSASTNKLHKRALSSLYTFTNGLTNNSNTITWEGDITKTTTLNAHNNFGITFDSLSTMNINLKSGVGGQMNWRQGGNVRMQLSNSLTSIRSPDGNTIASVSNGLCSFTSSAQMPMSSTDSITLTSIDSRILISSGTRGIRIEPLNGNLYIDSLNEGTPIQLIARDANGAIISAGMRNLQSGTTYTVVNTDALKIIGLSNTAARTITLPAATAFASGVTVWFKDEAGTAGTGNIVINRAGSDTIDGATSYTISANYGFIGLYSDGSSKWFVR